MERIKYVLSAVCFLLICGFQYAFAQEVCPIIPRPAQVKKLNEQFNLNANTPVISSVEVLKPIAHYIIQELLKTRGLPLSLQQTTTKIPGIELKLSSKKMPSGYVLDISAKGVVITAGDEAGAFYGAISLLQIVRQSKSDLGILILPGWNIEDKPLYEWRGIMLDESRHFFGVEKVKSVLDWMAFYKLNRFHWHLTDEPAWRIEIKKYPKLALVGGIGDYLNETLPAQYYTQEQRSKKL